MKKDVRKTIAVYVIICFVVFSFGYTMVPLFFAIKKTNNVPVPVKTAPKPPTTQN